MQDVARRCEAAGETWRNHGSGNSPEDSQCSGPAGSLGIAANVDIAFCDGRACTITIDHVPKAHWTRSAVTLKANLETKYGPAQESSGTVPESCRSEQAFARCLEARDVALHYKWTWAGGESIQMTVGKTKSTDHAAIWLVYHHLATASLSAL